MGGRAWAALVVVVLLPAVLSAQASRGTSQVPAPPVERHPPAPSHPSLPPPPAPDHGSENHPGSRPPTNNGDQFLADEHTYAPHYDQSSRYTHSRPRFPRWYAPFYGYGGYVPTFDTTVVPDRESEVESEGRLALRVTPGTTQVFVDGLYVGVAADFDGQGLWLEAGPRRIELRADGYDTATFDVRIVAGEVVTYRRNLTRLTVQSAPPPVAAAPKTFFVIPGCYAGDRPPRTEELPQGCNTANLRTVPPAMADAR